MINIGFAMTHLRVYDFSPILLGIRPQSCPSRKSVNGQVHILSSEITPKSATIKSVKLF